MKTDFVEMLLVWYKKNNRDYLPWRRTRDPYKILVAEMMLQKTTSTQVVEVFESFIKKYPSPEPLAKAPIDAVEEEIKSLGLARIRAKRFQDWSNEIVIRYSGQVPRTKKELISLSGVGEYIANAVLCLAFGEDVPLLDTNVVRVLWRIFGIKSEKARPRTDKALWNTYASMIPKGKGRAFNLAVLDFAALVCKSKNPNHEICPFRTMCLYIKSIESQTDNIT